MNTNDITEGDIVIVEREKQFPMQQTVERRSVVNEVKDNGEVDLGIDGVVSCDQIVDVIGKSPSVR